MDVLMALLLVVVDADADDGMRAARVCGRRVAAAGLARVATARMLAILGYIYMMNRLVFYSLPGFNKNFKRRRQGTLELMETR